LGKIKGTIAKVKHDLCTVVKHIEYKISKYLVRETKTGWMKSQTEDRQK
jgi:hypothetical protein